MILLLLLQWQRQYSFTSGRYSSSIHYFRSGSESPMKKKRIYLDDAPSQKGKAAFIKRILLSVSKASKHIFFFFPHLMLFRSTFDTDFDENTIPRFSLAKWCYSILVHLYKQILFLQTYQRQEIHKDTSVSSNVLSVTEKCNSIFSKNQRENNRGVSHKFLWFLIFFFY